VFIRVHPCSSVLQKCHVKKGLQYFESYAIISPVATYLANAGDWNNLSSSNILEKTFVATNRANAGDLI